MSLCLVHCIVAGLQHDIPQLIALLLLQREVASWFGAWLYEKKTGEIACTVARKARDAVATCWIEQDALRIGGV